MPLILCSISSGRITGYSPPAAAKNSMGIPVGYPPPPPTEPWMYRSSFPKAAGMLAHPVDVCQGQEMSWTNLQIILVHRHVRDTIVITEKENCPLLY